MTTWDEAGQRWDSAGFGPYGGHFAVVLSLVFSLALVAIISKTYVANPIWVDVAVFAVPIPIALYFDSRIVGFGAFSYVAAIALILGAAILFGI